MKCAGCGHPAHDANKCGYAPGGTPCECIVGASTAGVKYDKDKDRWDLLPFRATSKVVAVLTYGAKKYAPENWRKVDGWRWRYFGAALRHMVAWFGGEKIDPESGHPHLAHASCCLLFMLELDQ